MTTREQIDGVPIIDRLDFEALTRGEISHLWFEAAGMNIGQSWYLPVSVIKGVRPGPRLLIANGVQGEHVNGLFVIQRLIERIDPTTLTGTILMLPQINIPALHLGRHNITTNTNGGLSVDLNRMFPGTEDGSSLPEIFAGRVWHRLIDGNVDLALDLHTPVEGLRYPYFVFADWSIPEVRKLAEMLAPDIIKDDLGQEGSLETELNKRRVPCLTVELTSPKQLEPSIVDRAVEGVLSILSGHRMIAGSAPPSAKPVMARDLHVIATKTGGIAEITVRAGERVAREDRVAIVRDAFGRVREEHCAPVDGIVLAEATDPLRESGAVLARIIVPC